MTPAQLKDIRKSLGYSINQMAKAVGVNARTWRRYEMGERNPREPVIKLVRALASRPW